MNLTEKPAPPLSDERVEQLWQASAPRILRKPRQARAQRLMLAMAAGLVALVATGLLLRGRSAPVTELTEGQAALGPTVISLHDRSTVALEAKAEVQVQLEQPGEVRLALNGGRARFAVSKNRARDFHVLARGVDVRVVGTKFVVEDLGDGVLVSVEEGVVEVRAGAELRRLTAGQSWRASAEADHEHAALTSPPPAPPPEPLVGLDLSSPEPTEGAPTARDEARPKPHRPAHHQRVAASPTIEPPAPPAAPAAPTGPSADELFRAGLEARRTGHAREARSAWHTFLATFPDDARAGLASFELGRIEMDVTHDLTASLAALDRALKVAPGAAFAEDALARVVQLHDQRHDLDACKVAKAQYLSRYPAGTYAASLASLCGH
jgi:TolA-binding protein